MDVRRFSLNTVEKKLEKAKRTAKNQILSKVFGKGSGDGEILWGLLHIKIIKCVGLLNLDRLSNFSLGGDALLAEAP